LDINLSQWDNFISEMRPKKEKQLTIFGWKQSTKA
jgi:hypothetical protein